MNLEQEYCLSTYAIENRDKVFLSSILTMLKGKLDRQWCEECSLHYTIVDIDLPEGLTFWQQQTEKSRLIILGENNTVDAPLFLQKPLKFDTVEKLYARLGRYTQEHFLAQKSQKKTVAKHTYPVLQTQQNQYLADLLRCAQQQQKNISFSHNDEKIIYSHVDGRCWINFALFDTNNNASRIAQSFFKSNTVTQADVSYAALQTIKQAGTYRDYSMNALLWLSSLYAPKNMFIEKIKKQQIFQLKRWPSFTHIKHIPEHLHLGALMLQKKMSLDMIVAQTRMSEQIILPFFNACYTLGLIRTGAGDHHPHHQSSVKHQLSEKKRHLFNSILKRLE